jgi:hypothetical protein
MWSPVHGDDDAVAHCTLWFTSDGVTLEYQTMEDSIYSGSRCPASAAAFQTVALDWDFINI